MTSRRTARVSEAVRQTVSMAILTDLRDPRIQNVTVTKVDVAGDLRTAKVYVSIMGDEAKQKLCLHGLDSARGYLQAKVADRMQTRYTPVLRFVLDDGVKKSIEAARILREVLGEEGDGSESDQGVSVPTSSDHHAHEYGSSEPGGDEDRPAAEAPDESASEEADPADQH